MIIKKCLYPWGEGELHYDSFVFKTIDSDTNEVIDEDWITEEKELKHYEQLFERIKENNKELGVKTIEHNAHCFTSIVGKSSILTYLCGFINDK